MFTNLVSLKNLLAEQLYCISRKSFLLILKLSWIVKWLPRKDRVLIRRNTLSEFFLGSNTLYASNTLDESKGQTRKDLFFWIIEVFRYVVTQRDIKKNELVWSCWFKWMDFLGEKAGIFSGSWYTSYFS